MADTPLIRFGPFAFDPHAGLLWRGTELLPLQPKDAAVLGVLLRHAGQVVTKEVLLQTVWPKTFVSDTALKNRINRLRRVLRDDPKAPQWVATWHRRGYRFISQISAAPELAEQPEAGSSRQMPPAPTILSPLSSTISPITLVGRETELQQLHAWLARALGGQRQSVFITGEAGVGKTTLVEVFVSQVKAMGGVWIAHGQCIEHYGAGEPYRPVLEALERLGRGSEGTRLWPLLRQEAPTWLAQMPGLLTAADAETLRQLLQYTTPARMLRELAGALDRLTAEIPVVVVLEDLHWSDYATVDLLAVLAQRRDPARLLIIATYRPADVQARDHALQGMLHDLRLRGACHELPLTVLPEPAVAAYLRARLPAHEPPTGLASWLHYWTSGHPLFLVTVVDYLMQQGWLKESGHPEDMTRMVKALARRVPDTLRRMIETRLSRLTPMEQQVLEVASVAGSEFSAAAVAAGLEAEVVPVEAQCEALARRGDFLQAQGGAVWPDGTVATSYGFLHALYQQVIYERIPAAWRQRLHQRIGARLEQGFGQRVGEIAAALALHWQQGWDPQQAITYRQQAAANALRQHAYQEATEHLTTALALLESLPETSERARQELGLLIALGPPLSAVKGQAAPEVEHTYRRAQALCRQVGDTTQLAPALMGLRVWSSMRGMVQSARETGEQLLDLAQRLQEPDLRMEAHRSVGTSYFISGEFVSARGHLEQGMILGSPPEQRSLPLLPSVQAPGVHPQLECLVYGAYALWYLGYPDQALQRSHEALRLAQVSSHPYSLALTLTSTSWVHQYRREAPAAQKHAEAAVAVAAEYGFVQREAIARIRYGWALAIQGQAEAGIVQLQQGLAAYRATGAEQMRPAYLAALAEAHAHAGQVEEGLAALREALALVAAMGRYFCHAELYRLKGELLLEQAGSGVKSAPPETSRSARDTAAISRHPGVHTEAEACFRQALEIAGRQHAKASELRAAMSLSRLWQRQGRRNAALRLLAPIYRWFTEGFDTADLQEAKTLLRELGAPHEAFNSP